jgi:DNA excision repair protein ERCC-8
MNQLLFNRSTGNVSPEAFARIQTTQRIHAIQPCPRLRFNGGEKEVAPEDGDGADTQLAGEPKIWAHQAGVNALAIDIDGRM